MVDNLPTNSMRERRAQHTGIRVFDGIFYVDRPLQGELKDWPAKIQDTILTAMEKLAKTVQLPLTIIHSRCDVDYGDTREKDRWFLHVIVSEIVAGKAELITKQELEEEIRKSITRGESIH